MVLASQALAHAPVASSPVAASRCAISRCVALVRLQRTSAFHGSMTSVGTARCAHRAAAPAHRARQPLAASCPRPATRRWCARLRGADVGLAPARRHQPGQHAAASCPSSSWKRTGKSGSAPRRARARRSVVGDLIARPSVRRCASFDEARTPSQHRRRRLPVPAAQQPPQHEADALVARRRRRRGRAGRAAGRPGSRPPGRSAGAPADRASAARPRATPGAGDRPARRPSRRRDTLKHRAARRSAAASADARQLALEARPTRPCGSSTAGAVRRAPRQVSYQRVEHLVHDDGRSRARDGSPSMKLSVANAQDRRRRSRPQQRSRARCHWTADARHGRHQMLPAPGVYDALIDAVADHGVGLHDAAELRHAGVDRHHAGARPRPGSR